LNKPIGDFFQLFVDLDGVLADFEKGVRLITGKEPSELHPRSMWPAIARSRDFYNHLEWMPDGKNLWQAVKSFHPVILTGLPMGKWAEPQKRSWCERELGKEIPVITGMSRHKTELALQWMEENGFSEKRPILIDDRLKLKEPWKAAGGQFILHLNSAESIGELKNMGFPI